MGLVKNVARRYWSRPLITVTVFEQFGLLNGLGPSRECEAKAAHGVPTQLLKRLRSFTLSATVSLSAIAFSSWERLSWNKNFHSKYQGEQYVTVPF